MSTSSQRGSGTKGKIYECTGATSALLATPLSATATLGGQVHPDVEELS